MSIWKEWGVVDLENIDLPPLFQRFAHEDQLRQECLMVVEDMRELGWHWLGCSVSKMTDLEMRVFCAEAYLTLHRQLS